MRLELTPYSNRPFLKCRDQNICHFGGGSQDATTSGGPWKPQQPYLKGLFGSAQSQYQDYTPQYFGYNGTSGGTPTQTGSSQVSPFNSQETGAISQIGQLGANGTPTLDSANSAVNQYANGSMLSGSNPYFQSVTNQIQGSLTPGLMSAFSQGTTDNPNVAYAASQGLGNAVGQAASQNYETQSQNQLNAASMAPYMYNTQLGGANAALTAGQASQTQAQNELSNQVNAYNYYQQLPYNQINQYASLINGNYGTQSTQSVPQQSLLGSIFSDARLKENIKKVGKLDNGLPVYSFNYIGEPTTHIGLLAQQVQKVHPKAVSTYKSLLMVDYAKAVEMA